MAIEPTMECCTGCVVAGRKAASTVCQLCFEWGRLCALSPNKCNERVRRLLCAFFEDKLCLLLLARCRILGCVVGNAGTVLVGMRHQVCTLVLQARQHLHAHVCMIVKRSSRGGEHERSCQSACWPLVKVWCTHMGRSPRWTRRRTWFVQLPSNVAY
jgi:hypothetical protein